LAALDAKVRAQLRDQIRRIQLEVGTTTLFVTHDQEEALAPRSLGTNDGLASLHRELAANVPFLGADSGRAGAVTDRNVVLRMAPPFALDRATAR
jgi:ABC-type thiamine transport system ATPase subunit